MFPEGEENFTGPTSTCADAETELARANPIVVAAIAIPTVVVFMSSSCPLPWAPLISGVVAVSTHRQHSYRSQFRDRRRGRDALLRSPVSRTLIAFKP